MPQTSYEALGAGAHRSAWGTWFETSGPWAVMNSTSEVRSTSPVHVMLLPPSCPLPLLPLLCTCLSEVGRAEHAQSYHDLLGEPLACECVCQQVSLLPAGTSHWGQAETMHAGVCIVCSGARAATTG